MNPTSESKSNIQSDVEITGTITFKGELIFDGQLRDGDLIGEVLILGPKAGIKGNIEADALAIHGSVTGDVLVTGKCELKGSASLTGSLTTNRLVMDEGATLIGAAEITPGAKKRSVPPALGQSPQQSAQFPAGSRNLARMTGGTNADEKADAPAKR
jgi:cytoskeletal protein CcmA (bactofilin family)